MEKIRDISPDTGETIGHLDPNTGQYEKVQVRTLPFAKLFDFEEGQLLVTIEYDEDEPEDEDSCELVFRTRYRGCDFKMSLGFSSQTAHEMLSEIDEQKARVKYEQMLHFLK